MKRRLCDQLTDMGRPALRCVIRTSSGAARTLMLFCTAVICSAIICAGTHVTAFWGCGARPVVPV